MLKLYNKIKLEKKWATKLKLIIIMIHDEHTQVQEERNRLCDGERNKDSNGEEIENGVCKEL